MLKKLGQETFEQCNKPEIITFLYNHLFIKKSLIELDSFLGKSDWGGMGEWLKIYLEY